MMSDDSLAELLQKKEFAELRSQRNRVADSLTRTPANDTAELDRWLRTNSLTLQSHQIFVRHWINPNTPYHRLLIKHGTGTGKTLAALGIAMQFIRFHQTRGNENPFIFIIGFSKSIFQRELLRWPEFGFITREEITEHKRLKYLAESGSAKDRDVFVDFEARIKKRLTRKNRGGYFRFFGYKEFFNRLFLRESETSEPKETAMNTALLEAFEHGLLICDEIHNVYNSSETNNYGLAIRALLKWYDEHPERGLLRTILMSATPINNNPEEIIDLLNLLVPRIQLRKEDFFVDSRNLQAGALDRMRQLVTGYVSFLSDNDPRFYPERKILGEEIPIPKALWSERSGLFRGKTIPYLKFTRCPMSELQRETFRNLFETSGAETLPPDGQSLADIALPNPELIEGTRGRGLFRLRDVRYSLANAPQEWLDKVGIAMEKLPGGDITAITGRFLQRDRIGQYSAKYAEMLDRAFENLQTSGGKVIINHQYVHMSGVLFIQEVFRQNGIIDEYSAPHDSTLCSICGITKAEHSAPHSYRPARCVIYHGEINKITLDRTLEKFNADLEGYRYRFLIGSKIINEGIDFVSVREVWVMSVPPNIPTLIQILGRAVRKGSHLGLPPEQRRVSVRLFVSSYSGQESETTLSYEERKYFEKTQTYLVIQQLEKVLNECAIDANINREIIAPPGASRNLGNELGDLYFEPIVLVSHKKKKSSESANLATFRAYYADEEIALILYVIKRLFVEQSRAWVYDDLWSAVRDPPFELSVNPAMFLEENFLIALFALLDGGESFYRVTGFRPLDSLDHSFGSEHRLVQVGEFLVLFPIVSPRAGIDVESDEMLGDRSAEHIAVDIGEWVYHPESAGNQAINITKQLRMVTSYAQMKLRFYDQYANMPVEEMPTSTEVFSLEFHTRLAEDAIRYCFGVLVGTIDPGELHEFYFRMLYFYDRLDLILYAYHLEGYEGAERYTAYITEADLSYSPGGESNKIPVGKYNAFLMTSVLKSHGSFNLRRLDEFLGLPQAEKLARNPKLADMEFPIKRRRNSEIRRVHSNMLPIGHFLDTTIEGNTILSVPKVYLPESDDGKQYPWTRLYSFVQSAMASETENDLIVGYYEKNPAGLDIRFKLRPPIQKMTYHQDTRLNERGSACATHKKAELAALAGELKLSVDPETQNIREICDQLKLELIKREMFERRRSRHGESTRLRYFYLHYERHKR